MSSRLPRSWITEAIDDGVRIFAITETVPTACRIRWNADRRSPQRSLASARLEPAKEPQETNPGQSLGRLSGMKSSVVRTLQATVPPMSLGSSSPIRVLLMRLDIGQTKQAVGAGL
jgi:hypothetical protein